MSIDSHQPITNDVPASEPSTTSSGSDRASATTASGVRRYQGSPGRVRVAAKATSSGAEPPTTAPARSRAVAGARRQAQATPRAARTTRAATARGTAREATEVRSGSARWARTSPSGSRYGR